MDYIPYMVRARSLLRLCGSCNGPYHDARHYAHGDNLAYEMPPPPSTRNTLSSRPYVSREDADKVLDMLPDLHWRLFFALGRYAGLRLPSEAKALRWEHVDWEAGRIRVQVPKLEHHDGKGERVIPIFAELKPFLVEAFENATEGETRAVPIDGLTNAGMSATVQRAITAAKVKPWRAPLHSLRASCETDLAHQFPVHVVADWIGHDIKIAQKHYLQIRETDFANAAAGETKAMQKALQYGGAPGRMGAPGNKKPRETAVKCCSTRDLVGDKGLEPLTSRV